MEKIKIKNNLTIVKMNINYLLIVYNQIKMQKIV
jgi:hypothetical protein